jgi:RNA polymerase sigma-70 factor (ECF subfamily)
MRVIEGLSSYAPQRPFSHWLYTIALNTGRNHVRRRTRETSVDPSELEAMPCKGDGAKGCPEDILCARLVRLVTTLPEPMREVVSMRIGSDLSYSEIGKILGIPEGTARSRMHNAIASLKEILGVEKSQSEKERP